MSGRITASNSSNVPSDDRVIHDKMMNTLRYIEDSKSCFETLLCNIEGNFHQQLIASQADLYALLGKTVKDCVKIKVAPLARAYVVAEYLLKFFTEHNLLQSVMINMEPKTPTQRAAIVQAYSEILMALESKKEVAKEKLDEVKEQ